jgi:hypothetical protein
MKMTEEPGDMEEREDGEAWVLAVRDAKALNPTRFTATEILDHRDAGRP